MILKLIFVAMTALVVSTASAAPSSSKDATTAQTPFFTTLVQTVSAPAPTHNCVNPGGSCDGTVPCCDPYNNACFRNRCVPYNPQN